MNSVKVFLTSIVMFVAHQAVAGGTQIGSGTDDIKCRVDISGFQMDGQYLDVQVLNQSGKVVGIVNGVTYNRDIKVESYKISPDALATNTDDDSATASLNKGELRIATMNYYLNSELKPAISFNMSLEKITSVKLYDLEGDGDTNQFGGVVLVDGFDQNDQFVGRFVSSMLPGQCNDL